MEALRPVLSFFGAIQCWAFYCSEDFVHYDNSSSDFTNKKSFHAACIQKVVAVFWSSAVAEHRKHSDCCCNRCVLRPVSTQTNWPQTTCLLRSHGFLLQAELGYWIMLPVAKYYGNLHCPSASHEIIPISFQNHFIGTSAADHQNQCRLRSQTAPQKNAVKFRCLEVSLMNVSIIGITSMIRCLAWCPGAGSNYILASRPRSQRVGVADAAIFCRKAKLQVWGTRFVLVLVQIGWNSSTKQYANRTGGCSLEIRTMCECFCFFFSFPSLDHFLSCFNPVGVG